MTEQPVETAAYADGKALDIHRPSAGVHGPVILLWHGSGPDERDVLHGLASSVAAHGCVVVVPDWQSDDPVAGPRQLLASVAFLRERSADFGGNGSRVVLAGWSLGANAALWLGSHPEACGDWVPHGLLGLAGSYDESPFGDDVYMGFGVDSARPPVLLIHGSSDPVVPASASDEAACRLRAVGVAVALEMVETDHAGIVGTSYDLWSRRCVPTVDPDRLAVRAGVARRMAEFATKGDGSDHER